MDNCTHPPAMHSPLLATRHQQLIPVALKRGAQRGTILRFDHVCSTDTSTLVGSGARSPPARARQSSEWQAKQEQALDARRTGLDDNDARSQQLVVIGGEGEVWNAGSGVASARQIAATSPQSCITLPIQ
jgi:hypothetical protein